MDMFDRDNELSMLIVKQLVQEDGWNHYVFLVACNAWCY